MVAEPVTQPDARRTGASAGAGLVDPRRWWALAAVCVGIFMLLLDLTIVNVALPNIAHDLHASLSDLQWVIDAYALTLAALQLTAGSLGDLFGRRVLFAIGIAIFTAGSLLCALSNSSLFLILARGFQGVGGAVMFATSLALIAGSFSGRERGIAFAIYGAVTGIAVAIGPLLGGVLTSGLSWRWIFYVNLPIGVGALLITLLKVPESRQLGARRLDRPGFVVFSAALGFLVFGLIETTRDGWTSALVVSCLASAFVLLVVFVVVESRRKSPMLDLNLLRVPTFTGGLIAAFGVSSSIFSVFTYLVLYLQDTLGLSPVQTGVRFLLISGAILVASFGAGRLTNVVPIRWLITPGFVLVGVGCLLMSGMQVGTPWTHLIWGFLFAGIGIGFVNVPLVSTAVGVVAPERSGMAAGFSSTMRQVGIATGIAVLGSVFASTARDGVVRDLATTPLAPYSGRIAQALVNGGVGSKVSGNAHLPGLAGIPPSMVHYVVHAAEYGSVVSISRLLVIVAVIAFVAAAACLPLIRQRDFRAEASGITSAAADAGA